MQCSLREIKLNNEQKAQECDATKMIREQNDDNKKLKRIV
jgi:hypothetical protein